MAGFEGLQQLHEAAWPDMFANLQTAYAELTEVQFQLERRTREVTEARDLFQRVIESMSEALLLLDRSGRILQANRTAGLLLDQDSTAMIGRDFREVWPDERIPCTPWELLALAPQGKLIDFEVTFRTLGGASRSTSLSCSLVRDQRGKVTGVLIIARDVTSQKEDAERIRASLREKEVLLKEIHHRVKNNLQVISSLLSLQSAYISNPEAREMFRESQNRVKSMALVHEKLYQSEDLGGVDFERYVRELAAYLFRMYGSHLTRHELRIDIGRVMFGIDVAIPCGLIVNELISNALKHAFTDGRRGEILIQMQQTGDRAYILTVRDNGVGIPGEIDFRKTDSLGLQLVNTLVDQLDGEINLDRTDGTAFQIRFEI